ncbi:MAG: response regulator [Anaerolineae bacterium]|nr:response regulator [Anaerolineae bacterium]
MDSFEQFRQELRDGLNHLHNPDYQPSELLCTVLGCDLQGGAGAVQSEIIQVIEGLEPPAGTPSSARVQRDFDILHHRFVLKLTQEETAERLHMSVRSTRRAQREATHALARLLWEHNLAREVSAEETKGPQNTTADIPAVDWRSQVRQDMASLKKDAPGSVADVKETINYAVEIERSLTARHGISLQVGNVQPSLVAATHPSALRQILIMAIAELARGAASGTITIDATLEAERIQITLTGPTPKGNGLLSGDLIGEILAAQGGSVEVGTEDGRIYLRVEVPSAGKITVLVIDDNLDIVHFYRRCTTGTRYHIVHAAQGQRTVEAVEAISPDIIVLDIILPDADGWELLTQIHDNPATRSIPIIISSIVREEDLASALGATLYLPKPVKHKEFTQALDQALARVSTKP